MEKTNWKIYLTVLGVGLLGGVIGGLAYSAGSKMLADKKEESDKSENSEDKA